MNMVIKMPPIFSVGIRAAVADLRDDLVDLREPFEREVFALQRDEQFVRGGERIRHQDAERRRAIEQHEVERGILPQRLEARRAGG